MRTSVMRGDRRREQRKVEPPIIAGRVPPHDLDAEAAVLSAMLLDRDALDRVFEILRPEHFYSDANGKIFEACEQLSLASTPVDLMTVAGYLRDREQLAGIGGAAYIAQLADATPSVANVATHARIVHDKWRVRQMIATCQRIAAEGYGDIGPVDEFFDTAEQQICELSRSPTAKEPRLIAAVMKDRFQQISEASDRGDRLLGTATGLERLDAKLGGLRDGDLIIVAARPGMGKTSLASGWALDVATKTEDKASAFFSIEMPEEQVSDRVVCSDASVDIGKLRQGFLQPADWQRMSATGAKLAQAPLWVDDSAAPTLLQLRAKVRRVAAEARRAGRRLALVVIDYLQLMKAVAARSREEEIASIARGLKELAKQERLPIVALSQLNRSVETRHSKNKRPQLADLRESGEIEQAADAIVFIYRDEYYNPEHTKLRGIAELIIAKQRNGPTGRVFVRWMASTCTFANLTAGEYPSEDEIDE